MEEKGRENFGKVQEKLVIAHFDDECFNLLKQRFATVRSEERPIFLPRCLLNVMRGTITAAMAAMFPGLKSSIASA
jgi:hypothetical protein